MAKRSTAYMPEESDNEGDIDIVCGQDCTLIPDGVYEAQCTDYNIARYFDDLKLYLTFKITTFSEHLGKEVKKIFRLPKNKKIAPSSNYYKAWKRANGNTRPSKHAKMSPRIFKNKRFEITTRTVKKDYKGNEMPEHDWYSVVDEIVKVTVNEEQPF